MATVRVIKKTKAKLSPVRLLRGMGSFAVEWFVRIIEWTLPYSWLLLALWLFLGDSTPHMLVGERVGSCVYYGIHGEQQATGDCPFIRILP